MLSPLIILGGIFSGLFTVAQAAVVSVVYGAIVSVMIYKTLTWTQCIYTIKEGLEVAVPLLVPIVLPVAFKLGVESYHLLVGMVGIQSIGLVKSPVGLALFTMLPISKLSIGEISKKL